MDIKDKLAKRYPILTMSPKPIKSRYNTPTNKILDIKLPPKILETITDYEKGIATMTKFHVTREEVDAVLMHQYTQDDFSRGEGPHKTTYYLNNNYSDHSEAFWMTALALEASARQRQGNFDPIHLPDLIEHLN